MEQKESNYNHKPIILKSQFLISVAKKASFQAITTEKLPGPWDLGVITVCSGKREAVNLCGPDAQSTASPITQVA